MAISKKVALASAALVLAITSAAIGSRAVQRPVASLAPAASPAALSPFAVAALLAEAPPDVVVIALDAPRHPMRGAEPLAAYGGTDDALLASAPKRRRIVLAGLDLVRQDRLARALAATGRDVLVLAAGTDGWDKAMDADPPPPAAGASEQTLRAHRADVALRRSFGDAAPQAATPLTTPLAPAAPSGGSAPKKREGC